MHLVGHIYYSRDCQYRCRTIGRHHYEYFLHIFQEHETLRLSLGRRSQYRPLFGHHPFRQSGGNSWTENFPLLVSGFYSLSIF